MSFNPSPEAALAFRSLFNDPLKCEGDKLFPSERNYGQFSTGGNLHDTFRVDRYENIYGGHTSAYLKDIGKIKLDW